MSFEELVIQCDIRNLGFIIAKYNLTERGLARRWYCEELFSKMLYLEGVHSYPYVYYALKLETIKELINTNKYFIEEHYNNDLRRSGKLVLRFYDDDRLSSPCFEPFTLPTSHEIGIVKKLIKRNTKDFEWLKLARRA